MGLQDLEVVDIGSSDEETPPKSNLSLQDIILQALTAFKDKCFGWSNICSFFHVGTAILWYGHYSRFEL